MPANQIERATRLGVVQYLNTKPLVYPFEAGVVGHSFDLVYDVPSECGRKLHASETDVALIPAIEIGRAPETLPYSERRRDLLLRPGDQRISRFEQGPGRR